MKKLLQKIGISSLALISLLMFLPQESSAQYCGFDYVRFWRNYAIIDDVIVEDITESSTVLERVDTGYEQWATIDETDGPYEFNIGNDFELQVQWGVYYRGYVSAYIDKNDDQRWDFNRIGPDEEFLGIRYRASGFRLPPPIIYNEVFEFTIGEDVPEGPSVMRIKANAYNRYTDPCTAYFRPGYQWAYGEIEDYAINFVAPVPETYPTNGDILFNNEDYDGTQRMFNGQMTNFDLPAVIFKGPQRPGTKFMYEISGPLPSTEVVYTALDPTTLQEEVLIRTNDTKIEIESASGVNAKSIVEGTFSPTKGGEYKVKVTLIKSSGKRAEGINVFTVANNFDMSVADIISPRTSRFPRFFKYLRNTNIAIDCEVQNTGLNPVSKFEVYATIYDADTDNIVETLPKVVFDATNDPNVFPLQSGEKHEVNFANFRESRVGEYYIEFEVRYDFDEEEFNNWLPREGGRHYFEIQFNDQLTAGEFQNPKSGDTLKVNKPHSPVVEFLNNGISDASNVNFRMTVEDETGNQVYSEVSFLEDLPQGRYNSRLVTFPNLIIREEGKYKACAWVEYLYDPKKDDDTTCVDFYVEKGIQDTITVGEENALVDLGETNTAFDSNNNEDKVIVENSNVFAFSSISPNPASNTTILTFIKDNSEEIKIQIADLTGKLIFENTTINSTYTLNVENFPSGMYTIIISNNGVIQTKTLNVTK